MLIELRILNSGSKITMVHSWIFDNLTSALYWYFASMYSNPWMTFVACTWLYWSLGVLMLRVTSHCPCLHPDSVSTTMFILFGFHLCCNNYYQYTCTTCIFDQINCKRITCISYCWFFFHNRNLYYLQFSLCM